MPQFPMSGQNQRVHARLKLPAMYTLLRARVIGSEKYTWTGHIYDISVSGMRLELDIPIEAGTLIEVRAMLPGKDHTTFRASGRVVRLHSDEENLGPAIMGLTFEAFRSPMDHQRLCSYLEARGVTTQPQTTISRAA